MTERELLDKLFDEVLNKCKENYADPNLIKDNFEEWKKQCHKHEAFTEVLEIIFREIKRL